MKKNFSYSFILATLIVGMSMLNAAIWEKKDIANTQLASIATSDASSSQQNDYFFTAMDSFCVCPASLQRNYSRTQQVVTKTNMDFQFSRIFCISQLTQLKLYATKSIYVSFYAEKQLWGYYIYALRKLLI